MSGNIQFSHYMQNTTIHGLPRPIHCCPNRWPRWSETTSEKWGGAPSRWNHMFWRTCNGTSSKGPCSMPSSNRKYVAPMRYDGRRYGPFIHPSRKPAQMFRLYRSWNPWGHAACGFSSVHTWLLCELRTASLVNWASSVKRIPIISRLFYTTMHEPPAEVGTWHKILWLHCLYVLGWYRCSCCSCRTRQTVWWSTFNLPAMFLIHVVMSSSTDGVEPLQTRVWI